MLVNSYNFISQNKNINQFRQVVTYLGVDNKIHLSTFSGRSWYNICNMTSICATLDREPEKDRVLTSLETLCLGDIGMLYELIIIVELMIIKLTIYSIKFLRVITKWCALDWGCHGSYKMHGICKVFKAKIQ